MTTPDFLRRLAELESSSPQVHAGAIRALREADRHDSFAGARLEPMGDGTGLVLEFALGSARIERYFGPVTLAHDADKLDVDSAVRALTKQRRARNGVFK